MCVHLDEWMSGCRKERKEGGNSVEKTICSLSPILTLSPLPPGFAHFSWLPLSGDRLPILDVSGLLSCQNEKVTSVSILF